MEKLYVLRFKDGSIIKGKDISFSPARKKLTICEEETNNMITTEIGELKAIFCVRDLLGNREYSSPYKFFEESEELGKKVIVRFFDGEEINGHLLGLNYNNFGFFFIPSDEASNNISIFAPFSAVKEIVLYEKNSVLNFKFTQVDDDIFPS